MAFKPNAKTVAGRYRGEIAAFRLASALGLANVPPACPRSFAGSDVAAALGSNPSARRLLTSDVIIEGGRIHGAAMPWMDGLRFWPLEKEPLRSQAAGWLKAGAPIPTEHVERARQTSTLIAFDYLTDNWDRYSGANVGLDASGRMLLYVDNDAAFMASPPKQAVANNAARLKATDRFSRSFIERLRTMNEARLLSLLGDEREGQPLIPAAVVARVARRIETVTSLVDAKIAANGADETLYFP